MHTDPQITPELTSSIIAEKVAELLNDKKAEKVIVLDVRNRANFADFMIIATGNVGRQVVAMADYVVRFGKDHHLEPHVEGMELGDWVLVDLGGVLVHLFKPEIREHYNLEKMWSL